MLYQWTTILSNQYRIIVKEEKDEIQGKILDLDGVICFTDEYHYLAWKALADRLGIPFDQGRNNLLRGVSRMAGLEIILEKAEKNIQR